MNVPVETQHTVDELLDLVFQDELTGLFNRRYLNNRIGRDLENTADRRPYSFLLLDIDFFKAINDTHGHSGGDLALECVGKLLRGFCADDEVVVRFAGDEFVFFLPGASPTDGLARANDLVERGRSICIPVKGGLDEIQLTFSVGVASFPDEGEHWDQVLDRADQALYRAKRSGRDRAAAAPPAGEPITRGDDLSQIFPCPEYVGQDAALDWMQRHFDRWRTQTDEPHAPIFLCLSEHGTGKTRFLSEFAAMTGRAEIPVLQIDGSPELTDVCYGGLIRGLMTHMGSLNELRELTGDHLTEAEHALWERFLDTSPEETDPVSDEASSRLFTKILQLLTDQIGIVVLVDDAEYVDESTQSLLESIHVAGAPETRLFIVAAASPTTEGQSGPINLLSRLNPPAIELHELDEAGTRKMITAILPTLQTDDVFYQELQRVSRGNFMYIEEALKYLIQIGRLVFERSSWQMHDPRLDDLPASLRELVARRLDNLDPELRATLEKASVVGREIRPELLTAVEDADSGHTLDLLDKARKLGLLDGGRLWEDRDYHFQYATVKDVAYDQIPEEDRIVWHKQMASLHETLRDAPGLLQLGSLQYHLLRSDQEEQAQAIKQRLHSFVANTGTGSSGAGSSGAGSSGTRPPEAPLPITKAKWPKPAALSGDELILALRLFHSFRASLQTARLYPAESGIVRAAYEDLHTNFGRLFVFVKSLDLAEAEGELLINGEQRLRREDEKTLVDAFRRSLRKVGLTGIAFARGITLAEIQSLMDTWLSVRNLEQEPSEAWHLFCAREDIVHIDINARIYIALDDGVVPGFVTGDAPEEATASPESTGDITNIIELFQRWASQEAPDLDPELSREEKAHLGDLLCKLRELFFSDPSSPQTTESPLAQSLNDLVELVPELPDSDLPTPDELTQTGSVEQCVADVISGNAMREARGYQQLALLGPEAADPLYRLMTHTEDARVGQVAAEYLKALAIDLVHRVKGDLQHKTDPAVKLRLLQYAVPLIEDLGRKKHILVDAVTLDSQDAALEAIEQLTTQFPDEAAAMLLTVMSACPEPVQVEICIALDRIGDPLCVEPLLVTAALWPQATDDAQIAVIAQACQTLGQFDSPEIVAQFDELLTPPSRLPWKKTPPLPLRKAALVGLEKIGGEQVCAIIAAYTDDRDSWIRLRARRLMRTTQSDA